MSDGRGIWHLDNSKQGRLRRLEKEIFQLDKLKEKNKDKARWGTYIVLAIILYVFALFDGSFESTLEYLLGIPASLIVGVVIFYISLLITTPVSNAGIHEQDQIEILQRQVYALEREIEKEQD